MSSCQFPKGCEENATVKVTYESPEEAMELCKTHFEIEDPEIKGKYYQLGAKNIEVLTFEGGLHS